MTYKIVFNDLKQHLNAVERSLIVKSLEECLWNVAQSARNLGLKRTTLWERMKTLEITRFDEQQNQFVASRVAPGTE